MKPKSPISAILLSMLCITACSDGKDGKDGKDGEPGPVLPPSISYVAEPDGVFVSLDGVNIDSSGQAEILVNVLGLDKNGRKLPYVGLEEFSLFLVERRTTDGQRGPVGQWINGGKENSGISFLRCTGSGIDSEGNKTCSLNFDETRPGIYTVSWDHEVPLPLLSEEHDLSNVFRTFIKIDDVADSNGVAIEGGGVSNVVDFTPSTGETIDVDYSGISSYSCTRCHDGNESKISNIEVHGNWSEKTCVACHSSSDAIPDSKNFDESVGQLKGYNPVLPALIHRLHFGHNIEDKLRGEAKAKFGDKVLGTDPTQCQVCHQESEVPNLDIYVDACQSCHIDVNWDTGEGHSGIVISDDSTCESCHAKGRLSIIESHRVGARKSAESALKLRLSDVSVLSGEPKGIVTFDLSYNAAEEVQWKDAVLLGELPYGVVEPDGSLNQLGLIDIKSGIAVGSELSIEFDSVSLKGNESLYFANHASICTVKGKLVSCPEDKKSVMRSGIEYEASYWNLGKADGTEFNVARMTTKNRSVPEDKCNQCHNSLTWVELTFDGGSSQMTTCLSCHSNNEGFAGSFYSNVAMFVDGKKETSKVGEFFNKDFTTVVHRYHSGEWIPDDNNKVRRVAKTSESGSVLEGYPGDIANCKTCHTVDSKLFNEDGGLLSGKSYIAISKDYGATVSYISPIAESCRSCHVHNNPAAKSHFLQNGATLNGNSSETRDGVSAESCGVCHAEGKKFGIDVAHSKN